MPNSSAQTPRPGLAPPLADMIQLLRTLVPGHKLTCHALVVGANHRCLKSYRPWAEDIEPMINVLRTSEPPYDKEVSAALVRVLLCEKHRDCKRHVTPLHCALTTVRRPQENPPLKGCRVGSDLPPRHKNSLRLPKTDAVTFADASWELQNQKGDVQCIAYDAVAGRCRRKPAPGGLADAQSLLASITGEEEEEEEGDDEDGDDDYQEPESVAASDGTPSPLSQLWPLIQKLLCRNHRQWFWLQFYYDRLKGDVAIYTPAGGSSEYESDSEPDIAAIHEGRRASSGYETARSTLELDSDDEGRLRAGFLSAHCGAIFSAGSGRTPSKPPSTPKRPTNGLKEKAHTDPGKAVGYSKECQTQESQPIAAPKLLLPSEPSGASDKKKKRNSTAFSPSRNPFGAFGERPSALKPPKPTTQPRRSLRLSSCQSPSYGEQSSPSTSEEDDDAEGRDEEKDDMVARMSKLHLNDGATVLTEGWSRKIVELLYEEVRQPLSNSSKPGCLYLMLSTSLPGLVKVGRTANPNLHVRRKQIKKDCNLDDLDTIQEYRDVDYHERVELLAHRHLRRFLEIVPCVHKSRVEDHQEWFRCDPELARRVVKAWVEWMKRKPYKRSFLQDPWLMTVEDLKLGPEGGELETFDELFERHRGWLQQ